MIRKIRNCCETCENLVCVATTIGQLQHSEYLKLTFLDTFEWTIRQVFPATVTLVMLYNGWNIAEKAEWPLYVSVIDNLIRALVPFYPLCGMQWFTSNELCYYK